MFPNNVMNNHASVRKLISFRRRMYCIMFLLLRHYVLPHSGNGNCRYVRTDCLNVRCDFFLVCRVFYVTRTQNRIDSFAGNQSIITVQPHRSQLVQHIQQGFQIGYCNCYPTTDWARLVYATRHRFPRSLATAPVATERRSSFGQRASVTSWSVFVCVHVWHVLSSVYMLVCMLWTVTAYGPVSFRAAYLFACQPKRCYRSKAARQQNQQHRSDRMYINT